MDKFFGDALIVTGHLDAPFVDHGRIDTLRQR
jgi:hypothetical protein